MKHSTARRTATTKAAVTLAVDDANSRLQRWRSCHLRVPRPLERRGRISEVVVVSNTGPPLPRPTATATAAAVDAAVATLRWFRRCCRRRRVRSAVH